MGASSKTRRIVICGPAIRGAVATALLFTCMAHGLPQASGSTPSGGLPSPTADSEADPTGLPSTGDLQNRIADLQAMGSEDAASEIRQLRQAIALLAEIDEVTRRIDAIEREIAGAPAMLAESRAALERIRNQPPPIDEDLAATRDAPVDTLFAKVDEAKAVLDAARRRVVEAREAEIRRARQGSELASSMDEVRARQTEAANAARLATATDPMLVKAATVLAVVEDARQRAERALLRIRPQRHVATAELAAVRLQIALERARMAEEAWRKWSAQLAEIVDAATTAALAEAESAMGDSEATDPLVRVAAARNAELVQTGRRLLSKVRDSMQRIPFRLERAGALDRMLLLEEQRLALGGSRTIGPQLRQELAGLGQLDLLAADLEAIRREMLEDYLLEIELGDEIVRLQDPRVRAAQIVADSGLDLDDPGPVIDRLSTLLETRRSVLVRPLLSQLRQALALRDEEARATVALLDALRSYRAFVLENLLAIRTGPPLGPAAIADLDDWRVPLPEAPGADLGVMLLDSIESRPLLWLLGAGGLLVVVAWRPRLRRTIRESGVAVRRISTDRFGLTVAAAIRTAILAAPLPLAVWVLARVLRDPSAPDALMVFGSVLTVLTLPAATVSLLHAVAMREGLGEVHFQWAPATTRRLRLASWILVLLILPLYGLSMATLVGFGTRTTSADELLGRIGLAAVGLGTTVCLVWALRPSNPLGTLRSTAEDRRRGRGERARRRVLNALLVVAVVLTPTFAAVLAWFGYSFAAIEAMILLARSVWLVLLVLILREMLERSLSSSSRRIALEQAQRRRAEAAAKAEAEEVEGEGEFGDLLESPQVDLESVNAQAYRIVNGAWFAVVLVGLATIWSNLLPAFGSVQELVLWNSSREVPSLDGGAVVELVPVTLFDAIAALLVIALTTLLTRNIPGLLQLLVLPRLPLSAGVGYAVVSFTRYGIGVVGILVAVSLVGLRWNQVQWLASAAVLGLSFGLQEIFSNFVSGVLMLVEQPVRVGDVVTVNGVTGRVSRIQIRATTITDWDRHELVIPNKAFITGQFSNWTLSDNRTRQVISVGVAYGSDYRLVERLLLEAAAADPDVASDPPPSVVMHGFGESSVDFDLRVVVTDVSALPAPTHRIRLAIADAFAEHGIEIPFPQRDLHLKSIDETAADRLRRDS